MLILKQEDKQRLTELRNYGSEEAQKALDDRLLYLAFYNDPEKCTVRICPSHRDPYIDVTWEFPDRTWMYGAIVNHGNDWGVHT